MTLIVGSATLLRLEQSAQAESVYEVCLHRFEVHFWGVDQRQPGYLITLRPLL